jgi:glutaredoxin 3
VKRIDIYGQQIKDKTTGELKPCRYCEAAKRYLTAKGIAFNYRDLANLNDRQELLRRLPDVKTVPQIFIGEQHIGGFDDMARLPDATLQQMIGE